MPSLTTREVAAKLGCDVPVAHAFMTAMVALKLAEVTGKRKRPDGKGKPSNEYAIKAGADQLFRDILAKLA